VIVIDLGTATTYDVILKNGNFIGGIIAPGIETSAKALHANTGKLPLVGLKQLRFPRKVVGRNTLEAIQSGLMYSASISVDGMIRQIEKDYNSKFKIVLTGGLSKVVYHRISFKAKLEKNMVMKGLNEIIKYNYPL
jgi:type III pantothenate kinase